MTPPRPLGRSGIAVSACTLGTATLRADDGEVVTSAFDRGIDTVELDAGDAATVDLLRVAIARVAPAARPHLLVRATSLVRFDVPSPQVTVQSAYPGERLRAEVEALLVRLGVERLALVQLHAWCPEWLHEGDWLDVLERLRAEGKIAGIGVSLFDHDVDAAADAVASGRIDAVQVMLNLFDQGPVARLLPLCRAHDVAVIARSPLYYGALAPSAEGALRDYPVEDWRSAYFFDEHRRETTARVARLADTVVPPDSSVADLALRWCLAQPAVATVAVGMRTQAHIDATLAAFARGPLDTAACGELERHRWLC